MCHELFFFWFSPTHLKCKEHFYLTGNVNLTLFLGFPHELTVSSANNWTETSINVYQIEPSGIWANTVLFKLSPSAETFWNSSLIATPMFETNMVFYLQNFILWVQMDDVCMFWWIWKSRASSRWLCQDALWLNLKEEREGSFCSKAEHWQYLMVVCVLIQKHQSDAWCIGNLNK